MIESLTILIILLCVIALPFVLFALIAEIDLQESRRRTLEQMKELGRLEAQGDRLRRREWGL